MVIICQLDFSINKVIIIIHNGIQKEGKKKRKREEEREGKREGERERRGEKIVPGMFTLHNINNDLWAVFNHPAEWPLTLLNLLPIPLPPLLIQHGCACKYIVHTHTQSCYSI